MLLKMQWFALAITFLAGCLASIGDTSAADVPKYEACFADGRRVEGNSLVNWHDDNAQPKLDSTELLNPGQPLRWLKDRRPTLAAIPESGIGFVEFVGGDRLPGNVIGLDTGEATYQVGNLVEPQLLVRPDLDLSAPSDPPYEHVRVLVRFVRRVVWSEKPRRDIQPGSLFLRDGRVTSFRSVRWNKDHVQLLTSQGLQTFRYREIAELHLPKVDFWESYLSELAILDPDNTARLVRFQTTAGLTMTGSTLRAKVMNNGGSPDHWFHMLQPAWSLDPLWVPLNTIHTRQYFKPSEIPLSRVQPSKVLQQSLLGGGWRWQLDQNSQEGPLISGSQQHGWGFGVHALSELSFDLPAFAKSFRTRIGLDQVSGEGGCVRARVFLTSDKQKERQQLFQSEHLVGSARGVDTGELSLPESSAPYTVTLQADPAHEDRPAGADPLDIRDAVDWLEPLVTLDPEQLKSAVAKHRADWIPAWNNWTLESERLEELMLHNLWMQPSNMRGVYEVSMRPGPGGVSLEKEVTLSPDDRWLLISVRRNSGTSAGEIHVRINGDPVGELEIPFFGNEMPKPLTIPLGKYAGQNVRIELEQHAPDKPDAFVIWNALTIGTQLPTTHVIFEDNPRDIKPNPLPTGLAQMVDGDPYSGAKCLEVKSADGDSITLMEKVARIRERPLIGEFRYLRFAVRITGKARLAIECIPSIEDQQIRKYDLGLGPPAIEGATRILHSAPTEWIVKTQDLYSNWGAYDLREIRLQTVGEGSVFIDHVYLARNEEDLNDIGAQDPLTLQQQTEQAQLAVFQDAISLANASMVKIEVEGKFGTGALITKDGFIVTTGYTAIAPGKEAKVTLADGRTVSAITLGINRDIDAAMLKVTTEGDYPFLEIGNSQNLPPNGRLATVAFISALDKQPKKGASLVRYRKAEGGGLWISLLFDRTFSGGPIVNRTGQLIGLASRPFGPGGTLALPMNDFNSSRGRLSRSEVWGAWPLAVTPHLGLNVSRREDTLQVIGLSAGGPAAQSGVKLDDELNTFAGQAVSSFQDLLNQLAQKLPGEKVTLQLTRSGQPVTVELELDRR